MYGDVVGVKGKEVGVEEKPPVEGTGIEVKASSRSKAVPTLSAEKRIDKRMIEEWDMGCWSLLTGSCRRCR